MKITVYVQPCRTVGQVTGVGKFIANAPLAVAKLGHDVRLISPCDEIADDSPLNDLPLTTLPYRRRTIEWGGALLGRPRIDVQADWLWCPAESFVAVRGARLAMTAHTSDWAEPDLPWTGEWRYRKLRARWRLFYRAVRQSGARLLAVSEFLKRRLIERVGVSGDRIHVVGHGVESEYYAVRSGEPMPGMPDFRPYVLVTGGLTKYKGGDRVVEIAEKMPHVWFVVVGADVQVGSGYPNLHRCGYRDVRRGLPALYANAVAVLVLSRYETFGVPAAEAMAAGVPVVVSNAGALPEVVGDAGFIVDGDDTAAIIGILTELLRDDSARRHCIARGRSRAENHRWPRTAQRIVNALEAVH